MSKERYQTQTRENTTPLLSPVDRWPFSMKTVILIFLFSALSMDLFASETAEGAFWSWFKENENRIFNFKSNQEEVFDDISDNLNKYQDGLVFEISAAVNGKREFVVSADGISELFPSVESLVSSSPSLKRWSIVAFRPRMDNLSDLKLKYEGQELDPSKLWIYSRIDDDKFDLIVYHPEYSEERRSFIVSATYILLDMTLGEYDVTKGIRYIDHQKLPKNPDELGLRPFSELRKQFDSFKASRKKMANKLSKRTAGYGGLAPALTTSMN
ncbi:hypothetical protein [Metapseudomonas boanensis]|uniref:Uncharacterized protein n=1 Tax=Metapseudomonas boanensis TaxID=2822138 RepID=A0ABS5XNC4_9GAMM|nr:hypothetical protein [Pseudomonas boanensis]MBT8769168.1 hypothetical protein [Pseudomonas boanensis]